MFIGFTLKDVIHKIAVRFTPAHLPNAKKPYHLKAVFQPELDIHDIAMKAAVYNIPISPKVIEDGLNAGIELMYYLVADGYKIKTPLFNLRMRIPGVYDSSETSLPSGTFPSAKMQISAGLRKYLREKVKLEFDGIDTRDGIITEVKDGATGAVDEVITRGNVLTIRGRGIKIKGDGEHKDRVGVFFVPTEGEPIKAATVALNNPKTLIVQVPNELIEGESYHLAIETQSSVRHSGKTLKKIRDIRSEFSMIAA
jgi:hypothetical protein